MSQTELKAMVARVVELEEGVLEWQLDYGG